MKDTKVGQVYADGIFVDTGSPHFVTFTDHLLKKDILRPGRELRFDPRFSPGGTNVDFAELKGRSLFVRTYERGVEAETLSCGTGVTASAMAAAFIGQNTYNSYDVTTQGGLLKVSFTRSERNFSNVWLEGPATFVFDGKISLTE
jgi:diaminopimelate epimerase